jgi:steroid delta-isomerase-like uncharacterized protein
MLGDQALRLSEAMNARMQACKVSINDRRVIMFRRIFVLGLALSLMMSLSAFTLIHTLHVRAQEKTEGVSEAMISDIAQRYTDGIWNKKDMTIGETLFSDDFIDHHPIPGQLPGREGFMDTVELYLSAFPDLQVQNDDVFGSGDRIVIRWTATGTHTGELMGIPASGNPVTITGIDILRIVDGQIAERWAEDNALELMGQIGALGSS